MMKSPQSKVACQPEKSCTSQEWPALGPRVSQQLTSGMWGGEGSRAGVDPEVLSQPQPLQRESGALHCTVAIAVFPGNCI